MRRTLSKHTTIGLIFLSIGVALMCVVAAFSMPYAYYQFLRWTVMAVSVSLAIAFYRTGNWSLLLTAAVAAILFNPIAKVPLTRNTWMWVDLATSLVFFYFFILLMSYYARTHFVAATQEDPQPATTLDRIAADAAARIRKRHLPPEVLDAQMRLAEIGKQFDETAFRLVSERVNSVIMLDASQFAEMIKRGKSLEHWLWGAVANSAGDLVESGQFHFNRGVLYPLGPGEELVRIFDAASDKLGILGVAKPEYIQRQKEALRKNIATMG